jgi:hypothetical protein
MYKPTTRKNRRHIRFAHVLCDTCNDVCMNMSEHTLGDRIPLHHSDIEVFNVKIDVS